MDCTTSVQTLIDQFELMAQNSAKSAVPRTSSSVTRNTKVALPKTDNSPVKEIINRFNTQHTHTQSELVQIAQKMEEPAGEPIEGEQDIVVAMPATLTKVNVYKCLTVSTLQSNGEDGATILNSYEDESDAESTLLSSPRATRLDLAALGPTNGVQTFYIDQKAVVVPNPVARHHSSSSPVSRYMDYDTSPRFAATKAMNVERRRRLEERNRNLAADKVMRSDSRPRTPEWQGRLDQVRSQLFDGKENNQSLSRCPDSTAAGFRVNNAILEPQLPLQPIENVPGDAVQVPRLPLSELNWKNRARFQEMMERHSFVVLTDLGENLERTHDQVLQDFETFFTSDDEDWKNGCTSKHVYLNEHGKPFWEAANPRRRTFRTCGPELVRRGAVPSVEGLDVYDQHSKQWLKAEKVCVPGKEIVLFCGHALNRATKGRIPGTLHRVRRTPDRRFCIIYEQKYEEYFL
ncbi:Isopenicillin N synthase-like [Phytophthora cactorum]|nr:Isopenicillin N synthase-like [Phytophthora cactorum]